MKTKMAFLVCVVALVAGCVTPRVTAPAPAAVDLRQFQKVKLVTLDSVNTAYSKKGVALFDGLLRGELQSLGYSVVDTDPQMVLEANITQFDPGSRATRIIIGFGAGQAACRYTGRVKDAAGNLLAEIQGGKIFSGMELSDNSTFKSDEALQMGLISYCVSQIGKFLQNNGREPSK